MQSELVTIEGELVTLLSVNARGECPIVGYVGNSNVLKHWNEEGLYRNSIGCFNPSSEFRIIEKPKAWENLMIDQPVMVKFTNDYSAPRHYAGNGNYHNRGMTSITNIENSVSPLDKKEWIIL